MRRKRNLLLANGHRNAGLYPIGMLHDEAALVIERENNRMASEAVLFQSAAATILAGEEGFKAFNELIDRVRESDA